MSLAATSFPAAFNAPLPGGLTLRPGERLERYTSEVSALVDLADGKKAVADAAAPIAAPDGHGGFSALDDTLEPAAGGGFRPHHGAVDTRVAADAHGGISFDSPGIRVRPQGPADPGATQVNGRLFYANTGTDTDLAVEPTPTGVETFEQIRSSQSPEDFSYQLDLPPGATVQPIIGESGFPAGAEVVRNGKVLMGIDPPAAFDADGQLVKTSYSISGGTLTMHVAHREGSYRYPLLADPNFNVVENDNPLLDTLTWGFTQSSGSAYYKLAWAASDNSAGHLQINAPAGSYGAWAFAQWVWGTAPNAFIYRIDYKNAWSNSYQCSFTGIYSPSAGAYRSQSQTCGPFSNWSPTNCVESAHCSPGYGDDNNAIVFGMINYTQSFFDGGSANWLNGAIMYEQDRHPASVVSQSTGTPSTWVDKYTLTPSATLTDSGLGVSEAILQMNGNFVATNVAPCTGSPYYHCPAPNPLPQACGGDRLNPCPANPPRYSGGATSWSTSFAYNTSNLASGTYSAAIGAGDIVQKSSNGPAWTVKVDHGDGLALASGSPSGSLWDARGGSISSDSTVNVTANNPYSGVGSVEVDVDGTRKASAANGNPCDGCPATLSYTLPINQYAEGGHTIAIVASDEAGHTKTLSSWQVTVQRTDMGQEHNNYGFDWQDINGQQDIEVNVANGNAFLRSRDLNFAQNQIDLPFERYLNTAWLGHKGAFGWRSTANVGPDISLSASGSSTEVAQFGDGSCLPFTKQADGSYLPATSDIHMSLVANSDGSWDLSDDDTGLAYHFVSGKVETITDADGAAVSLTYTSNGTLSSIQDSTTGTSTGFTPDANGDIVKITQGRQVYNYKYGGPDGKYLLQYTDPSGNITTYQYDSANRLTRVTLPDSTYWQLGYDSDNRVTSVQHVTDATNLTGPLTTYAYNAGSTVVTDPQNQQITYSYGSDLGLTQTAANPLPSDYQQCLDSLNNDGGSSTFDLANEADPANDTPGSPDPIGDALYCQTLNRDTPATTVDQPVYDPEPADAGAGNYDSCTQADGSAGRVPAVPPIEAPGDPIPVVISNGPPNTPLFGIADDTRQTSDFSDPHFTRLNVNHLRAIVPYDLMKDTKPAYKGGPSRLTQFANWYEAAKGSNDIMVSFEHSHLHTRRLPSRREYQVDTRAFMSRFSAIKTYSAWNEPNYVRQPTHYPNRRAHKGGGGPHRAAFYTYLLQRNCQASEFSCLVVAADFTTKTYARSTNDYEDAYKSYLSSDDSGHFGVPIVWAFHPYGDLDSEPNASNSQSYAFMQHAPSGSRFWFSEIGAFHSKASGQPDANYSQSDRIAYLIDSLAGQLPVQRLYYYYLWAPGPRTDRAFNTGLMDPGPAGATQPSTARPAYYQYQCRTNPSGGACPTLGQSNTSNP